MKLQKKEAGKYNKIGSIMKRSILTVKPDSKIKEAVQLMRDNKISCTIVTRNGIPQGIFTERDIVRMVADKEDFGKKVSGVMSSPLITAGPWMSFNKALDIMRANHIRRLPVIKDKVLKGLVTETDLLVASARALTDMRHEHQEMKDLAIKDELTGLYNRHYFNEVMKNEVDRAKRYGGLLSVIMIDIDRFKKVNDRFGHPTGDTILKIISMLLKKHARKVDIVCRYGGEEFVCICPISGTRSARITAERLRRSIQKTQFEYNRIAFYITISVGICKYTSKYSTVEKLIAGADKALYQAKKNGRNQVCVAD